MSAANRAVEILTKLPGIDNIDRDDKPGKARIKIGLDFEKMARLDVDFSQIYRYLRSAFTGVDITTMRYGEEEVYFRVYLGELDNAQDFINTLKVANRKGNLVPMSQFIDLEDIEGEPDFNHFDGDRSVSISASVDDKVTTIG